MGEELLLKVVSFAGFRENRRGEGSLRGISYSSSE
jgi:hypothetical protein